MHGRFFFRTVGTFGVEQSTRFSHKNRHFSARKTSRRPQKQKRPVGRKNQIFCDFIGLFRGLRENTGSERGSSGTPPQTQAQNPLDAQNRRRLTKPKSRNFLRRPLAEMSGVLPPLAFRNVSVSADSSYWARGARRLLTRVVESSSVCQISG